MLKNKLVLRRLALLLCLSLIIGIVPVGALSIPMELNASVIESANLLANGGFDDNLTSWNGPKTATNARIEVVDGAAKFTSESGSGAVYIHQTIDISEPVGTVYRFSLDFTRISGTSKGQMMIKFRNAEDTTSLIYDYKSLDASGHYSIDLAVPDAAAKKVYIDINSPSSSVASYTIDNVSLVKLSQEPDSTESTGGAESSVIFQDFVDGSAIPDASIERWMESNGGEETVLTKEGSAYKVGRGANNKLVFQSGVANVQYYAKSPLLPVTEGKTYALDYEVQWHFRNAVNGTVELIFVDAEGNVVGTERGGAFVSTAAQATWTANAISAVAPAEAVGVYIKFSYSHTGGSYDYWVRNLTVTEAQTDPTETTQTTESTETTQATESTESTAPSQLTNGDFEDGITGWPSGSVLSSYTDDKHSGNASMKFTDNNATVAGPYYNQAVAVEAGKTYKLSAWVKVLEGTTGYIGLYGIGSASVQKTMGAAGDWKQVEVSATIPADKTEVKIQIGANSGSNTIFLIDDMVFAEVISTEPDPTETTQVTDPTETTQATESTEGTDATEESYVFVDFVEGTPIPDASAELWKEYNGDEETVLTKEGSAYKVGRGANNKLVLQGGVANVQYYAKSPVFPVTGEMVYTANYDAARYYGEKVTATVELSFVDAQGNVLLTESADPYDKTAADGVWVARTISGVAPADAVGAYLKFTYMLPSGNNTYWVRNLYVKESEAAEEPTEDPNLMLSENFEVFANPQYPNSGPFGWISSDDAGSVYSVAVACAQRESIKIDGYYLLLQMTGNWLAQSPSFAVKPGYEYTADFVARKMENNEDFNGYLTICFVDMFDLVLKADKVTIGETYGRWAEETVKAVAPAGAVKAYLVFGIDNDNRRIKADYAVDNLTVMQSEEAVVAIAPVPDIPTNTIFEDNFQNYFTPEGSSNSVRIPNGWTASANSAALSCAKYDDYDGTMNLCLQNLDDKWLRTPELDAVAGYTYTAVFMEKKLNPAAVGTGGYAKLVFVNSKGDVIAEVTEEIGQAGRWTRNGIQAVAPAGAAKFYLEIGVANGKGSHVSYSIDDLQIIEAQGNTLLSNGGTGNVETNPATGDNAALILVSTLMVMTVALAVVVIKKRRFF